MLEPKYLSIVYMTRENPVSWLAQFIFIDLYVYLNLVYADHQAKRFASGQMNS